MSRILKRPMFKMGGNINSGIISDFERQNFDEGTKEEDINSIDRFQATQDAIVSDLDQTIDQAFPGELPDYAKPGIGLSEYLALARLGANILGSPNTGPGFARFAQRAGPAFGQFATEIDASQQQRLNRGAELEAARREALLKTAGTKADIASRGAATALQGELTEDQMTQQASEHAATIASNQKIAQWELQTQVQLAELDRLQVEAVLQDSIILQNLIRGSNPEGTNDEKVRREQAISQLEQLNRDKNSIREKTLSDLIKNDILQANASAIAAQIDADRPEDYRGLTADQIAAKMAKTQVDELLGEDELFVPDFDPNYVIPDEDLAWWSRGGKMPPIKMDFAEGGRVGLAVGGDPEFPDATPSGPPFEPGSGPNPDPGSPPIMQADLYTQQEQMADVMKQAPDFSQQQGQSPRGTNVLSFEELRARLPKEVSNEVIRLLAASEEALIDFAQIQTQDDIARFNKKFNADLVLPSQTQVV